MVKPGRYRHYKEKDYEVIGCAKHSETEEEFVVYRALWGEREEQDGMHLGARGFVHAELIEPETVS